MKLSIEPINQRDPRWVNKKLGTSSMTIGSSGCVISALSMLCTYFGHSINPDELNEKLKAINGYANTNLMIWEKLTEIYSDIKWDGRVDCPDTPAPLETVNKYLDRNIPVIVCVDFDPKEGLQQHFVLIIGKENNDYFINDPWTGECYYFSAKYGDPAKGIMGLRLYSGKAPESSSGGTTAPQNGLSERVTAVEIGLDKVNDELGKNTRRLDEIQRSVDIVSADRAILESIQAKLTELKETIKINSDTLVNTKRELRDEFRTNVEMMDDRIKQLEIPPIEGEGKKFDILLELGKLFIGKKK
jgi:hypothetical protein